MPSIVQTTCAAFALQQKLPIVAVYCFVRATTQMHGEEKCCVIQNVDYNLHYSFVLERKNNVLYNQKMQDSELLKRIGIAIKALRTKKGMTQQELSELCKVDRGFISSVERGTRNVSVLTLCLMINMLGVDFVSFIKDMDTIQ